METGYERIEVPGGVPVKAWVRGVPFEEAARRQVANIARLPIVHRWVAVMPDVHFGLGATIGSVIATRRAVIPAAVGVDIGCGMCAARTSLSASDLPDSLAGVRRGIERAVPHGRSRTHGRDSGAWGRPPAPVEARWGQLVERFERICERHPAISKSNHRVHLGTLGTGNHFIEICLDQDDAVWVMLHSGSRGVGNRIGRYFIETAKRDMGVHLRDLPDVDLAYLREGTQHFDDYVEAVGWAQDFAHANRELMLSAVLEALASGRGARVAGISASSRGAWGRAPTSCAGAAPRTASTAAATAPVASCRGRGPGGSSASRTTPAPPPGSSAARMRR